MRPLSGRACLALGTLLLSSHLSFAARCGETPREALVTFVLTDNKKQYEACFPEEFRKLLPSMDPGERENILGASTFHNALAKDGLRLRDGADEGALFVLEERNRSAAADSPPDTTSVLRVAREVSDGGTALLLLEMCKSGRQPDEEYCREGRAYAWLKFEDGDWRVTSIDLVTGSNDFLVLDDPNLITKERRKKCERDEQDLLGDFGRSAAILKAYYDKSGTGFPQDVSTVGELVTKDDVPDLGMNLQMFAPCKQNRCSWEGYNVRYERRSTGLRGGYTLEARPEQYGRTGVRSFYMDQSGVIRATEEDRAATERDDPPE